MVIGVCLVLLVFCGVCIYQREVTRQELAALKQTGTARDEALDYVLRYYHLHLRNSYVTRLGFEEKRCHHCLHPEGCGHHTECPWARLESLTYGLYHTAATSD